MLNDLLISRVPDWDIKSLDLTRHHWDTLMILWSKYGRPDKIQFTYDQTFTGPWQIKECFLDKEFLIQRSRLTLQRKTISDSFGLLGLSLINPKDDRVILTEGVSDYFTAKLLCPNNNVLGMTTLSGSTTSKRLILSLFNSIIICSDNDSQSDRNTGIDNSSRMRTFYEVYGKKVKVFLPAPSFKDITENLMFNLKLCQTQI